MRVGVVILPDLPWPVARERFQEAERTGFAGAWTYDHLSWRTLREGPWLGAVPLLSAAAAVTSRLRIGTLVTSPNYRHPALLAKDAMTLDVLSEGRFDLGIGAGGSGWDAEVLGQPMLTPGERADRFEEFVSALDLLLSEPRASVSGRFFTTVESRTLPGCVQRPRLPFTVAGVGPRALRVAARYGATWVTFGPLTPVEHPQEWFAAVVAQSRRLDEACEAAGRDPAAIGRMALVGLEESWAQSTVTAWDDTVGRLEDAGITDVVVHWPRPGTDLPGASPEVFDVISSRLADGQGRAPREQPRRPRDDQTQS